MDPITYLIQTETKIFYRKLWNLHLPKKIAITIWCISWNFIPALKNLRLRRVASDSSCPRCRNTEEDSNHAFRQCLGFSPWVIVNNFDFFAVPHG